jgi:hypothetical protein
MSRESCRRVRTFSLLVPSGGFFGQCFSFFRFLLTQAVCQGAR